MQFTCLRENLSKGLNTVGKAVPLKSSFPMLSNVLVVAEDGRLKLAGTNLNTAIVSYVGASVEEDGSITVPAKLLSEFVSHLSAETVSIKLKDDILHIASGSTRSKFNGANASDYPDLPDVNSKLPFMEIDPGVFNTAISQVGFSVALDDSRPVFSGVLLSYSTGVLTIVGSDGFRLSEKKIDVDGDLSDFAVVLPARTLLETARLFSTSDEKLKMYLNEDENLCLFEAGDTLVATRIIDGAYPDYQKIIPNDVVLTASFSSEELLEAVKLTSVFAKDSDNAIKLIVNPNGYVKVTSSSQETGENNTKVKADVSGNLDEPFEIVFNARYLLEMLTNNKYDTLVFHAKERTSPCLIVPMDEESFLHVMAPMQLNG